jgi:hypothetical protein
VRITTYDEYISSLILRIATNSQEVETIEKVFDLIRTRQDHIKDISGGTFSYEKHGPKCSEHTFWLYRDQLRFTLGIYTEVENLPSCVSPLHAVHVCAKDPTIITYSPIHDYDKLQRDVKINAKLGKFLTRFYSDYLSADEINSIANVYANRDMSLDGSNRYTFELLTSVEDIRSFYISCHEDSALHSCMTKHWDFWGLKTYDTKEKVHPVDIYGHAPELGVAVIRDTKNNDKAIGRVVVNTQTKNYTRIYGNKEIVEDILHKNKFKYATTLAPATCNPIFVYSEKHPHTVRHQILMPYIDMEASRAYYSATNKNIVFNQDGRNGKYDLGTIPVDICKECYKFIEGAIQNRRVTRAPFIIRNNTFAEFEPGIRQELFEAQEAYNELVRAAKNNLKIIEEEKYDPLVCKVCAKAELKEKTDNIEIVWNPPYTHGNTHYTVCVLDIDIVRNIMRDAQENNRPLYITAEDRANKIAHLLTSNDHASITREVAESGPFVASLGQNYRLVETKFFDEEQYMFATEEAAPAQYQGQRFLLNQLRYAWFKEDNQWKWGLIPTFDTKKIKSTGEYILTNDITTHPELFWKWDNAYWYQTDKVKAIISRNKRKSYRPLTQCYYEPERDQYYEQNFAIKYLNWEERTAYPKRQEYHQGRLFCPQPRFTPDERRFETATRRVFKTRIRESDNYWASRTERTGVQYAQQWEEDWNPEWDTNYYYKNHELGRIKFKQWHDRIQTEYNEQYNEQIKQEHRDRTNEEPSAIWVSQEPNALYGENEIRTTRLNPTTTATITRGG